MNGEWAKIEANFKKTYVNPLKDAMTQVDKKLYKEFLEEQEKNGNISVLDNINEIGECPKWSEPLVDTIDPQKTVTIYKGWSTGPTVSITDIKPKLNTISIESGHLSDNLKNLKSIQQKLTQQASERVAKQKDDIIESAIKKYLNVKQVIISDLMGRTKVLIDLNSKVQTFCIDDKPFLEIHPVKMVDKTENQTHLVNFEQKWRLLF